MNTIILNQKITKMKFSQGYLENNKFPTSIVDSKMTNDNIFWFWNFRSTNE